MILKREGKTCLLFDFLQRGCTFVHNQLMAMCEYREIEGIVLSNGKTIKQINTEVSKEVERIYLEGWKKGIAIPFWDNKGNFYLANPDGSEDLVDFNRKDRSYKVIARVADKGKGRYAYLLNM